EIRQQVGIAPTGLVPLVEVQPVAADVHLPVQRTGPADHPAAGQEHPAAVAVRLAVGVVVPVVAAADQLAAERRDQDGVGGVGRAGLDQADRYLRVGAQPAG